jgi:hypothetical protein
MIETEVEFNTVYEGQPLFADVDVFLRASRFVLWRLRHLVHYAARGLDSTTSTGDLQAFDSRIVEIAAQGGQLFWGHAWYLAGDLLGGNATSERRRGDRSDRFSIPRSRRCSDWACVTGGNCC